VARKGFANGAFKDLAEDVPTMVEEFFPDEVHAEPKKAAKTEPPVDLRGRLEAQVARLSGG
jgi:hypothetical protein